MSFKPMRIPLTKYVSDHNLIHLIILNLLFRGTKSIPLSKTGSTTWRKSWYNALKRVQTSQVDYFE